MDGRSLIPDRETSFHHVQARSWAHPAFYRILLLSPHRTWQLYRTESLHPPQYHKISTVSGAKKKEMYSSISKRHGIPRPPSAQDELYPQFSKGLSGVVVTCACKGNVADNSRRAAQAVYRLPESWVTNPVGPWRCLCSCPIVMYHVGWSIATGQIPYPSPTVCV